MSGSNRKSVLSGVDRELGALESRMHALAGRVGEVSGARAGETARSVWIAQERYVHRLNRGLLALSLAIILAEVGLEQIDEDLHKVAVSVIFCVVMLWFVLFDSSQTILTSPPPPPPPPQTTTTTTTTTTTKSSFTSTSRQPSSIEETQTLPHTSLADDARDREAAGVEEKVWESQVDGWVIKTEEERELVEKLRRRLADLKEVCTERPLNLSDCVLVRFLRARKSLDESEAMFRECYRFREEKKPQEIYELFDPSPVLKRFVTGGWCGVDKEGSLVFIDRVGQLDVPNLMARCEEEELLNFAIKREETTTKLLIELGQKQGKVQYQVLVIQDLKGMSMRHFNNKGLAYMKKLVFVQDNYYPERLKCAIVINAPVVFSMIWNVAKYFFDSTTRAKIQIYSGPAKKELLARVHPSELPKFLGGEKEIDGDPFCSQLIGPGGRIPDDL